MCAEFEDTWPKGDVSYHWVEHSLRKRKVGGSIPPGGSSYAPEHWFVRPVHLEDKPPPLGAYTTDIFFEVDLAHWLSHSEPGHQSVSR